MIDLKQLAEGLSALEEQIKTNPTPELLQLYKVFTGKDTVLEVPIVLDPVDVIDNSNKLPYEDEEEDDDEDNDFDQDTPFIGDEEDRDEFLINKKPPKTPNYISGSSRRECVARPLEPPKKIRLFSGKDVPITPEDKKTDDIIKKSKKVPRNRGRFEKIKVRCRKCACINKVSPYLIPNGDIRRYVCNDCCCGG